MSERDARGRFLTNNCGRPRQPTELTTVVGVRMTGLQAELAHAAADWKGYTLSELLRRYIRGLIAEYETHRNR